MNNFVLKYRQKIKSVLTGFDRLVFKGLISNLNYTKGMAAFLFSKNVLFKDFDSYVEKQTNIFRKNTVEYIEKLNRPYQYLNSSTSRKDEIAKSILKKDNINNGLICSLGTVEPCMSYKIFKNKSNKKLELEKLQRKCLHYYHHYDHPIFGLMSIRLQTWFPFDIQKIYPRLVQGAMCSFSSNDVMRFLGKKMHGNYQGEVITDFKNRPEGIRIKHSLGKNSIKMYDKKGIILRVETTINDPSIFKVYRKSQNSDNDNYDWKPLRKNVADKKRRSDVCNASNEHYLNSLSNLDANQPLNKLVDDICKPTKLNGKRVRAIRPWDSEDMLLLKSINQGEFNINGFRNKDIRQYLYTENILNDDNSRKKISAKTSRKLRLLRAHGIISKVNKTHRYILTDKGKKVISAVLQYQNITLEQLNQIAA